MAPFDPYKAPAVAHEVDLEQLSQLVPADRAIRLAARVVDWILYTAVSVVALAPLMLGIVAPSWEVNMEVALLLSVLLWCALAGVVMVMNLMLLRADGQTLGKKLLGVRVVRSDGSPAELWRLVWLRTAPAWVFNGLGGGVLGLVDAALIFAEDHRCVHDHMADTLVVPSWYVWPGPDANEGAE